MKPASSIPTLEQPCYKVPTRWGDPFNPGFVEYTQFDFLKWLPLIALLLVLSFVITTRRKTSRGGNACKGFFGIPEVRVS